MTKAHQDSEQILRILMREISMFMDRPGTKPSHRIYALGFLNKVVGMLASSGEVEIRSTALKIYFNLFNKLLHQDPVEQESKIS